METVRTCDGAERGAAGGVGSTVASGGAGVFYPLVARGARVAKDAPLGYVTDFFGQTVFEARAPAAGEVLYVCSLPSMSKGGTIANIGVSE